MSDYMYNLSVNTRNLENEEYQLFNIVNSISEITTSLTTIRNCLPNSLKQKQYIKKDLQKLCRNLNSLTNNIDDLGSFIHSSIHKYIEAEKQIELELSLLECNHRTTQTLSKKKNTYSWGNNTSIIKSNIRHICNFFKKIGQKIMNKTNKQDDNLQTNFDYTCLDPIAYSHIYMTTARKNIETNFPQEPTKIKDYKKSIDDNNQSDWLNGLLGIDIFTDIQDIIYDLNKWEWSWDHINGTVIDIISLLPIVGAVKYIDDMWIMPHKPNIDPNNIPNIDGKTDTVLPESDQVENSSQKIPASDELNDSSLIDDNTLHEESYSDYSETYTYTNKDGDSVSIEWEISNEEFLDSDALTLQQITDIMNKHNPGLVERGFDKAVSEYSKKQGINPKVILATLAQEQNWCKNGKYDKAFGIGTGGNPLSFAEGDKGGVSKSVSIYLKWFKKGKELESEGNLGPMFINHDSGPTYPETTAVFGNKTTKWQQDNPQYVSYMENGLNITPVNAVMYAKLKYTPWIDFPPQKSHPLQAWHKIFKSFE